jgi:hypothetical protein
MSDPAEQLHGRVGAQLPKLERLLERERVKAAKRAARQGIGPVEARMLALTPHAREDPLEVDEPA